MSKITKHELKKLNEVESFLCTMVIILNSKNLSQEKLLEHIPTLKRNANDAHDLLNDINGHFAEENEK